MRQISSKQTTMFKYKSNITKRGWWSELDPYIRDHMVFSAEIAGIQLSQFASMNEFDNAMKIIGIRNWAIPTIISRVYIKPYTSQSALDTVRGRRGQIIGRFPVCGTITCFEALMHLRRITGNLLPEFINRMILVEFLGLDAQIGCLHCQRANQPLDTVIRHQTETCPFHKPMCVHCVYCRRDKVAHSIIE